MKLSAGQIQGFLSKPPSSVRVFLFYGPDSGLAHERAEGLIARFLPNKDDPFAKIDLSGAALGADEARLYDEAASMVLGGGRRLIRVQQAQETNAKPLTRFLGDPPPGDSVIVIEAGDLDKRSKLRTLCEGATQIAAGIPCYIEDAAARRRTLESFFQDQFLRVSRDAMQLLVEVLPPDRRALRGEIEKLSLYAQGKKEITLDDVRAVIADAAGAEIDDLIQAAMSGQIDQTALLLDHLYAEQTSPVALLRAGQRHLLRLQLALSFKEQGMGAQEALKKLSPPVFWKAMEPMTRQMQRFSSTRVAARLEQFFEAEAQCKQTALPAEAVCAQLFMSIATKA